MGDPKLDKRLGLQAVVQNNLILSALQPIVLSYRLSSLNELKYWRIFMRYFYITFALILLFVGGCATDYRLAVIREARVFALKKHPDLSDKSMHCIKFYTPRLANSLVYSRDGAGGNSKQDIVQTCVIWDLPDQEGKSLMVVGYGERELHNWSPNRTILKRFRFIGKKKKKKREKKKKAL